MANTPGHEHTLAPKHVSSASSFETAFSGHNDREAECSISDPILIQQVVDDALQAPESSNTDKGQDSYQPDPAGVSSETLVSIPDTSVSQNHVHISPSTGLLLPAGGPNTNTVPEFLYQLTKMLTDNNRDIIEWSNGKIEVHNPHKLQTNVLNRYFRHSKFASFQRQLNYFGFRKLAGKGKMAPCSYVNDAAQKDLGSLLLIKRKVGNEQKVKEPKKRSRTDSFKQDIAGNAAQKPPVNPILANILYRTTGEANNSSGNSISRNAHISPNQSQQEIARIAVGRGIRHSFSHPNAIKPAPLPPRPPPSEQVIATVANPVAAKSSIPVVEASLSALKNNFQMTLEASSGQNASAPSENSGDQTSSGYVPGTMRRDDSLVDLAMIPMVDDGNESDYFSSTGLTFIDFPWQDPNPASSRE